MSVSRQSSKGPRKGLPTIKAFIIITLLTKLSPTSSSAIKETIKPSESSTPKESLQQFTASDSSPSSIQLTTTIPSDSTKDILTLQNYKQLIASLASTIKSIAKNVPNLSQVLLLLGVLIYLSINVIIILLTSLLTIKSPLLLSNFGRLMEPGSMEKLNDILHHVNYFEQINEWIDRGLYWIGMNQACKEIVVCRAGTAMAKDFPSITEQIRRTVFSIINSPDKFNRLTRMLMDAMNGTGECSTLPINQCPALTSIKNWPTETVDHHTIIKVVAANAWNVSSSGAALACSAFITAIMAIFIFGIVKIVLSRHAIPRQNSRGASLSGTSIFMKSEKIPAKKM